MQVATTPWSKGDPFEALYRSLGWQLADAIPAYARPDARPCAPTVGRLRGRNSSGSLDACAYYL